MDDPELFELVMDLPSDQRELAVRRACEGDEPRARRLVELVEFAARREHTEAMDGEHDRSDEPHRRREGEHIGRYVVMRFLGQGAFGHVYEVYDPELRRHVALKLLREDRATDADLHRFRREAQSLAQIDHPNVVRVYDAGQHEGRRYLTMELLDGASLRPWIESSDAQGWRRVLEVLLPAGRGLQAAHDAGFVHRDFKPENVMMTSAGRIVVTDFGIAHAFATTTIRAAPGEPADGSAQAATASSAAAIGTPNYMAPEQLLGHATPASDVYSFCRVLLEALGGRGTRHPVEVLSDGAGRSPVVIQLPAIRAPRWLRRVLERGLQPVPEHRFADLRELLLVVEGHRSRERWLRRALLAAAIVLPAAAYAMSRDVRDPCEPGPGDDLETTWSQLSARAQQTAHAEAAAATVQSVRKTVEWNLGEWTQARAASCRRHADGLVEPATARAREECFVQWHDELRHRLLWLRDHPEVLATARLNEEMPRNPTRCAYVEIPRGEPIETDSATHDALAQLLDQSTNLRIRGDYAGSADAAARALPLVDAGGHTAQRAEILLRLGMLAARRREPERAVELLERAQLSAERLGLDGLAAEGHAGMAETIALAPGWPVARARGELAAARAKVDRIGGRHDELEPELSSIEGHIAHREGRYAEAESAYRRAAEQFERINGEADYRAANARGNLARVLSAQGRHEEAIAIAEQALQARRALIGEQHPLIAEDRLRLGMLHARAASTAGRTALQTAATHLRSAADAMRWIHGPRSLPHAQALVELTIVRLALGEIDATMARDVGEFVDVFEDPATKGSTPAETTQALRVARNAYHALKSWDEARKLSERLVAKVQAEPVDLQAREDEILLISYLLHLGDRDRARQRLALVQERYGDVQAADALFEQRVQHLRDTLDPPPEKTTP